MNIIKKQWLWTAALAALLLAALGVGFTPAGAQQPVSATLTAGSQDITVGDVVPLTLRVTHPAGWRVIFPSLQGAWGEFEVRGQSAPQISANPDGTQTTSTQIQVARMRPGEALTPALSLQVADDQGSLTGLEVAPLAITVRPVLQPGDTKLADIKPQAELVTESRPYWPLAVAGLVTFGALAAFGVQGWRHRKQIDRRTPRQKALDTLRTLEAQLPQTQFQVKAYCAGVSTCLRDYLAASLPFPARDQTTREIARWLQGQEVPVEWSALVIGTLHICDDVKFANAEIDLPAIQALTGHARQIVEQYPPEVKPEPRRSGRKGKKAEVKA